MAVYSHRRSASRAASVLTVILLTALGAAGCDDGDDDPAEAPVPTSTSLADLDTSQLAVTRGEFCATVAPAAVEEALGSAATDSATWSNGDRAALAPGVLDVAHEYGCSWTGADAEVQAWVFAPPVTTTRARALARSAIRQDGCTRVGSAADFGDPSVAVRCPSDGRTVTTYHGLFGDAWLSCSLAAAGKPADLLERTDRWCATVAQAASARTDSP